ncbi:hypothetical protein QUA35_28625 [Microcoleus sp. N9_B2]
MFTFVMMSFHAIGTCAIDTKETGFLLAGAIALSREIWVKNQVSA